MSELEKAKQEIAVLKQHIQTIQTIRMAEEAEITRLKEELQEEKEFKQRQLEVLENNRRELISNYEEELGLVPEEEVTKLLKAKCDELGLREFCRQTGIDPGNLSNVLHGKRALQMRMGQVLGYEPVFRWRKINDNNPR